MSDFSSAFQIALQLIGRLDVDLRAIILLSLQVSLTASACAFAIGAPLGTALAVYRFRGRGVLVVLANTLLGLPPVVVGLVVYLLLSRSGPLGAFGLLFTPAFYTFIRRLGARTEHDPELSKSSARWRLPDGGATH